MQAKHVSFDVGPVAVAVSASIQIKTHLWLSWAEIALDHEQEAHQARQQALAVKERPGPEFGDALTRETHASMVAVAAASHAIDAFYGAVKPLITDPESSTGPQIQSPQSRQSQIRVLLDKGFMIVPHSKSKEWKREFAWLFSLRDGAVHFKEEFGEPVPHPAGTNTSPEYVAYAAESAERAVDLLLDVLDACIGNPRASRQALVAYTNGMKEVPQTLRLRRRPSSREAGQHG